MKMNKNLQFIILPLLVIIFLFFSFQQPNEVLSVDELKSKAEKFADEEEYDSAAIYFVKARKLAQQKKVKTSLQSVLEKELAFWTTRNDLENSDKRKQLYKYWSEFQNDSKFRQYYYDANSSLFLFEMSLDSFEYFYAKTLTEIDNNKDWNYEVMYNTFVAQQFFYADELVDAVKFIKKAEKSLEKSKDPLDVELSGFYFVCNEIYHKIGDIELALKFSMICLDIIKKNKPFNEFDYASVLNNIALNYVELEDYENGLKYYEEAIQSSLRNKNLFEINILYANLAECLSYLERNDEAIKNLKKSIEYSTVPYELDINSQILAYQGIVNAYKKVQKLDSARYYGNILLDLNKKTKSRIEITYEIVGNLFLDFKDFKNAKNYLGKSRDLIIKKFGEKHSLSSRMLYGLADVFIEQKKYKEGLYILQRAIAANTTEDLDSKDFRANPDVRYVFDRNLMMNELRRKSMVLDSMRVEGIAGVKAVDVYNTAKSTVDMLLYINQTVQLKSKAFWLNKKGDTYFQHAIYYALLAAKEEKDDKYKEEAFLISERSKSILLFESLQEKTALRFSGIPDSLIEKESGLRKYATFIEKQKRDAITEKEEKKVAGFEKELLQIQLEIDEIAAKIKKNYPEYYQLKYQELNIKPRDIMAKLDDSTVMIEYFQGNYRSFVFVLRKNSFECHQVLADSSVANKALDFQKLVSDLPYAIKQPEEYFEKYKNSALELYNLWLKPYLNPKDKGKRLVIISDGSLSYLPFEALLTTEINTKNPNYKSLPYLLKDYTINYDYSAELWLRHQQAKKQINGKIYAMAPTYSKKVVDSDSFLNRYRTGKEISLRSGIGELPGANKEIKTLKNKYKGFYPKKMNASEKAWKKNASKYGILHFAMHGLIDEKEPEYSSLVFAEDGNKEEDNFLYAYEIKQTKLNASMVVLSACETGAGKYQRGEGVLSLGRGFMYAGVPSVVMTLWKLNDQSASEVIGNFYKNLAQGQQKDKALQQAKIKYLETSNNIAAHPALWACFIQLGDYSAIKIEKVDYFNYLIISAVLGSVLALLIFFYRRMLKKH
jgi:CHAT domain-containing protein